MKGDPKISMDTVRLADVLIAESRKAAGIGLMNVIRFAAEFERCERALRAINERECNGYRCEADEDRDRKRVVRIEAKVADMAGQLRIEVHYNGDPRGSAVKIRTPKSGRFNSFGGAEDGWCV